MSTPNPLTLDGRRALCAAPVTLNGRPAVISGARCAFALVRSELDREGAEWSWDAVARIVAGGGDFRA